MNESDALKISNEIVKSYGLKAEFLGDFYSVGVGGDSRTYTKVIVLTGPFPGNEILASLSTQIGNKTGINRITFETVRKT